MNQSISRVNMTDYFKLSEALQNDMLEAAQHIRNALYNNPQSEELKNALIALDFPHFIPIENSIAALRDEENNLLNLSSYAFENSSGDIDNYEAYEEWQKIIRQWEDVRREKRNRIKAGHYRSES